MKRCRNFLSFTALIILLEVMGIIILATRYEWVQTVYPLCGITAGLAAAWLCGMIYLCLRKGSLSKAASRLLMVCDGLLLCAVTAFAGAWGLGTQYAFESGFSIETPLFDDKDVMIIVPHQDDDLNLMGGLIEQYTGSGSNVTVVFSTNGDQGGDSEVRAAEAVRVLTGLGVARENICYLGFGDQWQTQTFGDVGLKHIYDSPDPDRVWTSRGGASATWGTESIPCYMENLPYTRNNYVLSLQSVIMEKRPDTIFAVDFDSHLDHRGTGLLFEEALRNILETDPGYAPKVYKGYCYGTAWKAENDYYEGLNLLSTRKPDAQTWKESAHGYAWETRARFPMSAADISPILSDNSVYQSLSLYQSQRAGLLAPRILNGDKVFWERRTDSLLYGAPSGLLNDFKLRDFRGISEMGCANTGIEYLPEGKVNIRPGTAIEVNSVYLYDDPDPAGNILGGYIAFSDGSTVEFGPLEKDGRATKLSFPLRRTEWMEIVITGFEGDAPGLCEIEAFCESTDTPEAADACIMAMDGDGNFVYDYILHGGDTARFSIGLFPVGTHLGPDDVALSVDGSGKAHWEGENLVVTCEKGDDCLVTLSDGALSVTFTVSNPSGLEYAYMRALRFAESVVFNIRYLLYAVEYYAARLSVFR